MAGSPDENKGKPQSDTVNRGGSGKITDAAKTGGEERNTAGGEAAREQATDAAILRNVPGISPEKLRAAREALERSKGTTSPLPPSPVAQDSGEETRRKPDAKVKGEKPVIVGQTEKPTTSSFAGILTAATEKLGQPRGKRAREKTADDNDPQQELATLISSLIVIGVAATSLPKEAKPDEDEIDGFSYHFTNIIVRHIPIKTGLSADVLDIIGMLAVMASWYSRASQYMGGKDDGGPGKYNKPPKPQNPRTPPGMRVPTNDIEMVDPATAEFLKVPAGGNGRQASR